MNGRLNLDAQIECNLIFKKSILPAIQKCNSIPGSLLITENDNVALLWDLRNNGSFRSWNFSSVNSLTCPVMYDPQTHQLVAVQRHQIISVFKFNEDVNEKEEVTLLPHMRVKGILSDRQRLYVWLETGEVYLLAHLLRLCGHSCLSDSPSLQDMSPVVPLFRFADDEHIERILDVASHIRQTSLAFVINRQGQRYVSLYTFNADQISKCTFPLNQNELDIVCTFDHLVVIEPDHRVYNVYPESRTLLFDLSSLTAHHRIVKLKYSIFGKHVSVIVVTQEENGQQHMFAYDPTYRSETKPVPIEPLLDSYEHNLLFVDHKIIAISASGIHVYQLIVRRITLVEAICQQAEQSKSVDLNGSSPAVHSASELIQMLNSQLKPKELERTLVTAVRLLITSKQTDHVQQLQQLVFTLYFTHQFLVTELRDACFTRDQLSDLVCLLNGLITCTNQSINQIMDWLNALMDAYFVAFSSMANQHLLDLLKQTHTLVGEQISLYKNQKELKQLILSALDTIPNEKGKILIGLPDHKHLGYKLERICL